MQNIGTCKMYGMPQILITARMTVYFISCVLQSIHILLTIDNHDNINSNNVCY